MKTNKKSGKTLRKSGESQGKVREFDRIKKWEPCVKEGAVGGTEKNLGGWSGKILPNYMFAMAYQNNFYHPTHPKSWHPPKFFPYHLRKNAPTTNIFAILPRPQNVATLSPNFLPPHPKNTLVTLPLKNCSPLPPPPQQYVSLVQFQH